MTSSSCMARVSPPMNSYPERRSARGISAAGAAVAASYQKPEIREPRRQIVHRENPETGCISTGGNRGNRQTVFLCYLRFLLFNVLHAFSTGGSGEREGALPCYLRFPLFNRGSFCVSLRSSGERGSGTHLAQMTVIVADLVKENPLSPVHWNAIVPLSVATVVKAMSGIRGDRRMEVGAEDLHAVVGAHEAGDDVARDRFAQLRAAKARLHRVLDQCPDLEDLAALDGLRNVHDCARHQISPSSRQAESVTTTSALSGPESAVADLGDRGTVRWSANRTRVVDARPPRARRELNAHDVRLRVPLGDHVYGLHVVGRRHRALDGNRDGNELPLSMMAARRASPGPCGPAPYRSACGPPRPSLPWSRRLLLCSA